MRNPETSLLGKRILVTGGSGFLGSFVVEMLRAERVESVCVPRKADYDLTHRDAVRQLYVDVGPDIVIHLAATVGGIGANRKNPGLFFYDNMAMGLHVVDEAKRYGRLEKLVVVGTTCSYPKDTTTPFQEESFWDGYPEETNAPYGIAKKALFVMLQAYRQQYGLNYVYLIPANLYGPRDNFDLETGHVIPGLIRKFVEARMRGLPSVTVWGTGNVSREFLYVEDAAEAVILAAKLYRSAEPVNLGTGSEIRIRDLADTVRRLTGYAGAVEWDPSQPDGQPRRRLEVRRAWEQFGFRARTDLETGLRNTIDWYMTSGERRSDFANRANAHSPL